MHMGRFPTEEEGLSALVHKPSDWPTDIVWLPLLATADVPTDNWGNEFVYVSDVNLPSGFGIYSCGQDGVTSSRGNDPDDFNTWNVHSPTATCYQNQERRSWIRAMLVYLLILAGVVLALWEMSRIDAYLNRRRAVDA